MSKEERFDDFVWDITVPGLGEVWLRGEDTTGYPTQTWVNGELLRREGDGEFSWTTEAGVPTPVYEMDQNVSRYADDAQTACYLIRQDRDMWGRLASKVDDYSEWFRARAAAYAYYAETLMAQLDCE